MARVHSGQAPAWPLVSDRRGGRGSGAQGVGPEDHFCEAISNDLRVPLTVEGHPRTLSGPSPDPRVTSACTSRSFRNRTDDLRMTSESPGRLAAEAEFEDALEVGQGLAVALHQPVALTMARAGLGVAGAEVDGAVVEPGPGARRGTTRTPYSK